MHTLWWLSTLLGRQNNHKKLTDDFFIQRESNGIEYVTFAAGITKAWQCRSHEKYCLALPKMFVSKLKFQILFLKTIFGITEQRNILLISYNESIFGSMV